MADVQIAHLKAFINQLFTLMSLALMSKSFKPGQIKIKGINLNFMDCFQMLKIVTHLLHLVTRLQGSDDDLSLRRRVHHIVYRIDPRSTAGDSLLHLSVMKNNTLKSQNLFEEGQYAFFPSRDVTRLLIECGAKINATNTNASTPLHTASHRSNYRQEVNYYYISIIKY